jgi:putative DNA primase/helicase
VNELERIAADQQRVNAEAIAKSVREGNGATLTRKTRQQPRGHASQSAVIRCFQDVVATPLSWLWPRRIARGKVTLVAGDPGLGKSQLTASLAACVSVGGCLPGSDYAAPLGSVLFLNAEDDAADTIRPRLEAAGADVARIHALDAVRTLGDDGRVMQRGFDLARDIGALQGAARGIGDVALIVIDPISAYLGGTDSHRNADVRGLLAPLSALAADVGAAVLIVSHLNKTVGNDAMMRITGSLAFVAAARAAYIVARDP